MSCALWEPALVESARGGAPVTDELRAHLAACARCADRLAAERQLSAGLAAAARADAGLRVPPRTSGAVLEAVRAGRRQRRLVGTGRLLVAAAALLLAVLPLARPPEPVAPADASRAARFVSLPGAEPLAPGEAGQLVKVGLSPAALQALGWPIEMDSGGLLETELILGSDGVARALRLAARPPGTGGSRNRLRGGRR